MALHPAGAKVTDVTADTDNSVLQSTVAFEPYRIMALICDQFRVAYFFDINEIIR